MILPENHLCLRCVTIHSKQEFSGSISSRIVSVPKNFGELSKNLPDFYLRQACRASDQHPALERAQEVYNLPICETCYSAGQKIINDANVIHFLSLGVTTKFLENLMMPWLKPLINNAKHL